MGSHSAGFQSADNTRAESKLQFGRLNQIVEKVFKPITEDYFWGFLARDILGLWAPRIVVSLKRGRIPYDKTTDAGYGTRTKPEQWMHELRQNIKGLNYWNGWEETAREVQSGPGWMVAHAAIFGISMAQVSGKRALMMSHNELKHFYGLLGQALTKAEIEQLHLYPARRQREVMLKAFLRKALSPNLEVASRITLHPEHFQNVNLRFATPGEKRTVNWIRNTFSRQLKNSTVNGKDVFDAWINSYTKLLHDGEKVPNFLKRLTHLESIFEELVDQTNTRARRILKPVDVSAIRIQSALNPKQTVRMTSQQFMTALSKFSTALGEITKHIHPAQPLDKAVFAGLLEKIRRQIVQRKFILSPFATLVGGGLAFYVAAISQSEKT